MRPSGDADGNWSSVEGSDDGQYVIAGESTGRLYLSADTGASWSETQPAGNADKDWHCVASSEAGTDLMAIVYGGRVYRSTNTGASWSEEYPSGSASNKNWHHVRMSPDGLLAVVCVLAARAYGSITLSSDFMPILQRLL
jgi:photosystem II stability/assembly factor-like uncharacterized protein